MEKTEAQSGSSSSMKYSARSGLEPPVLDILLQENCKLTILKINGQWRLDLRCVDIYDDQVHYSKKGICLTLDQTHEMLQVFINIDEAMINHVDTRLLHLKNNVFANVSSKFRGVNIRQYFEGQDGLAPTKRGVFLRQNGWQKLRAILLDLENIIPDFKDFKPCHMQIDHLSLIGRLQCKNCNPNGFQEWKSTETLPPVKTAEEPLSENEDDVSHYIARAYSRH